MSKHPIFSKIADGAMFGIGLLLTVIIGVFIAYF